MADVELTQELLESLFDYDAGKGVLVWKERPREQFKTKSAWASVNARNAGKIAGTPDDTGRVSVMLFSKKRQVHRLIWTIAKGEIPEVIDHIDGNPGNNKISNLRNVSQFINGKNCKRSKVNKSGHQGVLQRKDNRKWIAYISSSGARVHIGQFETYEEAISARKKAEIENGYHGNHGRVIV